MGHPLPYSYLLQLGKGCVSDTAPIPSVEIRLSLWFEVIDISPYEMMFGVPDSIIGIAKS